MGFGVDIGKWTQDATKEMADLNKAIILELFASVILDTPVLEGRLRGNWLISKSQPRGGTIDITDPQGTKTTRKVQDFIGKLDGAKNFSVFLTNNLPYAYRIEYDGWSHTKAPEGMVRKNFIRVSGNLAANT